MRFDKLVEEYPTLRQSLLGTFDNCALAALFSLQHEQGWSTAPQARGSIFHRFAAEALRTLKREGERQLPTEEAMVILREALAQRDVPDQDVVRVPVRDQRDLRIDALKWCTAWEWDTATIVDIEKRLFALVEYEDHEGMRRSRKLTGQLDVLMADPPDGAIIVDWKTGWYLPPETPEDRPDLEEEHLSYRGYFQQRFYGWLVMRNYPAVDRVTMRECYPRFGATRSATLHRVDLEHVEHELADLAMQIDRALRGGLERGPLWKPSPGKHCLAGGTRFITDQGVRTLADACGEGVRVMDRHGAWRDATIRSFGRQPLLRVTFDDGSVVRATPDHRWWTIEGSAKKGWQQTDERVTTVELERAPLTRPGLPEVDPEGIRHGFTFGDGWRRSDRGTCEARFMPHDEEIAAYFADAPTVGGRPRKGDGLHRRKDGYLYITALPGHYKDLPDRVTPEYARGFVAGLLAADGSVGKAGDVQLFCEGAERAGRVAELARLGGCVITSVRLSSDKPTNYSAVGVTTRELMAVRIKPATAPLLKAVHVARQPEKRQMRRMYREVVSVEPDGFEDVYCAVVPGAESFTLANGIATSNCAYCPKPGSCPIEREARGRGAVTSRDVAIRYAAEMAVADRVRTHRREALKAYVDVFGPVEVRSAKGRLAIGWVDTPRGRRFGTFVPDGSDRGPLPDDLDLTGDLAASGEALDGAA